MHHGYEPSNTWDQVMSQINTAATSNDDAKRALAQLQRDFPGRDEMLRFMRGVRAGVGKDKHQRFHAAREQWQKARREAELARIELLGIVAYESARGESEYALSHHLGVTRMTIRSWKEKIDRDFPLTPQPRP